MRERIQKGKKKKKMADNHLHEYLGKEGEWGREKGREGSRVDRYGGLEGPVMGVGAYFR